VVTMTMERVGYMISLAFVYDLWNQRGTELIVLSTLCVDGLPCQCKPFVEPDLFPDLETFFVTERASLDQAVDAAVGKAVFVAGVIESVGGRGRLETEKRGRL